MNPVDVQVLGISMLKKSANEALLGLSNHSNIILIWATDLYLVFLVSSFNVEIYIEKPFEHLFQFEK